MKIKGASAVVTGAAGGIGRAIATALRERGAHLILTGRREAALDEVAGVLSPARVEVCDLSNRDEVLRLAELVKDADILVANAALPATGPLDAFSPAELERAVAVNLVAPMLLTQQLVPAMVGRGRGHLVYISSMGGKIPAHQLSIYAATKYGLRGFAGCLRQDLAGTGVGVSVVFPGSIVDAGMLADAGLPAAPGTKGLAAHRVGAGVVEVIEHNRGELDVAERVVRVAAKVAGAFPALVDKLSARQDGKDYADQLATGLGHLR